MKKIIKILPLGILAILSILLLTGRVRFGLGLGDMIYYGVVYISLIIYVIYFFLKTKKINLILPLAFILLCIYVFLSMTIWRGPEYSWNGYILAPTQKYKEERKQNDFEKKLSEFNKKIKLNPIDYNLRIDKGFFLRSNGKYELAIDVFKEAQKIEPKNYRAYWEAGYAFSLIGEFKHTIIEYEKAYNADTTNYQLKLQINKLKEKHKIE